ncbi:MAG: hypothetical protein C4341_04245 [Armatimonadota bacterium]
MPRRAENMEQHRITPLEVETKEFTSSFRGYSPAEVRAFLEKVAAEIELLTREVRAAKEALDAVTRERDELRQRESLINETLIAAQRAGEEIQQLARERADAALQQVEAQRIQIQGDIERLRAERDAFVVQMRSYLDAFYARLEDQKRRTAG